MAQTVYDFKVIGIDGSEQSMESYRDQVILIVNTASKCGLTPQYEGLEALYQAYKGRGFVVLGFPCDQFAHQEPGDEEQIAEFCSVNFGVTFPLFSKIEVNGDDTHPLWLFLRKAAPGLLGTTRIKWNFTKFLVDRQGTVQQRFGPKERPSDLVNEIEALLN